MSCQLFHIPEIYSIIYDYCNDSGKAKLRLINKELNDFYFTLESTAFQRLWKEKNNKLWIPLNKSPPTSKEIENQLNYFNMKSFQFHLNRWLEITNGRIYSLTHFFEHPGHVIRPLEEWDYLFNCIKRSSRKKVNFLFDNDNDWKENLICVYNGLFCIVMDKRNGIFYRLDYLQETELTSQRPLCIKLGNIKEWLQRIDSDVIYGLSIDYNHLEVENCKTKDQAYHLLHNIDPNCYCYLNENLKNDLELIASLIKTNNITTNYLPFALRNDKPFVLNILSRFTTFYNLPFSLRNDKEVVLKYLGYLETDIVEYISDELIKDNDILRKIIHYDLHYNYFVDLFSKESDRELLLKGAISFLRNLKQTTQPQHVIYIKNLFKEEKEILFHIINETKLYSAVKDGTTITDIIYDKEQLLELVAIHPCILLVASEELKNNKYLMMKCINLNSLCYLFLDENGLQCDMDIIISMMYIAHNRYLNYLPPKITHDTNKMFEIITGFALGTFEFPPHLGNDLQFMLNLMTKTGSGFWANFASKELFQNKEFIMTIISYINNNGWLFIDYFPDEYKTDKEIAKLILSKSRKSFFKLGENIKDDLELVKKYNIVQDQYLYISKRLRNDKELALKAINADPLNCAYLSEELRRDVKLMTAVIKKNRIFERFSLLKSIDVLKLD
ncbi:hypothetical protein ABK040_010210 [Willaertia magna]